MSDETTLEIVLSSESTVGNPIVETVTVVGTVPVGPRGLTGATGATGDDGPAGPQGEPGEGVPTGGTAGQVLTKDTGTDYDTSWQDPTGGEGGGVTDATYLVATAHDDLTDEVVVGATPGGELGGTWASPTVDATHSGSSHASVQAAAEATAAADATAKVAAEAATRGAADTALDGRLDTLEARPEFTTADETKLDHLTVTQAVDLDTIEARVNSLDAAVVLRGNWDASAGTFPGGGTAQAGDSYIVTVAGTVNAVAFSVGDRIVAIADNASTGTYAANWLKLDYTDAVLSVDGATGAVSLTGTYAPIAEPIAAAHIADGTDAHDATAISIADAGGNFTGTEVEAALAELADTDADLAGAIADGDASTLTSAQTYADGKVSDTAYDATSWNAVTNVAPSKNAVRDKFEALSPALLVESGAQSKTSALTELTTFTGDETFYVVEDDDGTPASRRVTIENLAAGVRAMAPVAKGYRNAASSPSSTTTPAIVAMDAEAYDSHGIFDTGTGRTTVPTGYAGVWNVTMGGSWAASATGVRVLVLFVNGSASATVFKGLASSSGSSAACVSFPMVLAEGDYLEWGQAQNSGGGLALNVASPLNCFLAVDFVRAV